MSKAPGRMARWFDRVWLGLLVAVALTGYGLAQQIGPSPTAGAATDLIVVDDNATNASVFPLWFTAAGTVPGFISTTKLSFNPSTSTLTATTFSGALSGNATTASNGTTWTAVSAPTTIASGQGYMVDTSGGGVTITLASAPAVGNHVSFADAAGTFNTNNLTVANNTKPIMGSATNLIVSTNNANFGLVYQGGTNGWRVVGY